MYNFTTAAAIAFSWAASIFNVPLDLPPPCGYLGDKYAEWSAVETGCWMDTTGDVRALIHHVEGWKDNRSTPARCREGCDAEGYGLAALERGQECWCGNTIMDNAYPVSTEKCNSPCAGDENQICGGYGYMSLYARNGFNFTIGVSPRVTPRGLFRVGCYTDPTAIGRQMPVQPEGCQYEPERLRTAVGCMDDCASIGYKYAGLQNGRECWCHNDPPPYYLAGGKCNYPCEGDATQLCGGSASLLVYTRDEYQ
ncbi:hypothetical protein VMCG_05123 [Cytospora schulzeri]|uniref:WSC domain-containing protein n=1 Tax=Cytospora schulzeri TaxID=448051 RepID=A0A423WQQ4_9PEZI|nr:hypothetical protein VMCG_05123 [Valsa malicola]